jgi:hypothetical protein
VLVCILCDVRLEAEGIHKGRKEDVDWTVLDEYVIQFFRTK